MGIADELITRGWTQRTEEDAAGRVCLRGAASYACFGDSDHAWGLPAAVLDALYWVCGDDNGVASWNDEQDRTFDEVLRAAKQADEILDAQ